MLNPARFLVWNLNRASSPRINITMSSLHHVITLGNIEEFFIPWFIWFVWQGFLQGCLQWEAARSCPCLTEPTPAAPGWTCHRPRLSPAVMVVMPLARRLRRGTKTLVTLAGEKKISAEGKGGCAACGEVPGPARVKPPPSGSHWACTNTSDVSRYL